MDKIYALREAKKDIERGKIRINWLLDLIQEWNTEDLKAFSTRYLRMMQDELNNIKNELKHVPTDEAIRHKAEVIHDAIGDYILNNREENRT